MKYFGGRKAVYLLILALLTAMNIYLWRDKFIRRKISPRAMKVFNGELYLGVANGNDRQDTTRVSKVD